MKKGGVQLLFFDGAYIVGAVARRDSKRPDVSRSAAGIQARSAVILPVVEPAL